MSIGADIKQILTNNGVTAAMYINDIPVTTTAVGIYATGGESPVHTLGAIAFRQPTFQVIVRSATCAACETLIESIISILDGLTNTTVNSNYYMSIRQSSDIINLGKSDAQYHQLSINFSTMVR